ncbi:MAG TPA: hypothetical protein H9870_07600 [Candidatus Corynebacterium avicola]|uniref:Alpha/beta hydrolase n=1 Tax=Candidatus Corynebacterium avicola TaxID=2838527 RepID=A0A9D1RRK9_9CORY|nr:hypothetical protein [Candidatus Corynebacterium avicola]
MTLQEVYRPASPGHRIPFFTALCAAFAALLAIAVAPLASAAPASSSGQIVHPPAQPSEGPGSAGPCGSSSTTTVNPDDPTQKTIVYSPEGSAETPLTGGHCNDAKRPTVVLVHGLMSGIDAQIAGQSVLHKDLIDHYVSQGNVVVFSTWATNPYDFEGSIKTLDKTIGGAEALAPRGDFDRLGIVGHSMGGGAVPYLAQKADERGWGSEAMWLFQLAPAFTAGLGTGPIELPEHARVVVEGYDNDQIMDNRVGIEMFNAYTLPDDQKKHITVHGDGHGTVHKLDASHMTPNTMLHPEDALRYYGIYRTGDALQSCSLTGQNCDEDLSYMGRWSDGTPVTPATVTNEPADVGPTDVGVAVLDGECTSELNSRAANCPA